MSGSRRKWLTNLVKKRDLNMLISIRKHYGKSTADMDEEKLLRAAKKLWPLCGEKENWGC